MFAAWPMVQMGGAARRPRRAQGIAVSDRTILERLTQFPFVLLRRWQQTIGTTGHVRSNVREGRFCATLFWTIRNSLILNGEMSEWLKEHAWKACVGETLPWVRIPLSPPILRATKTARDSGDSSSSEPMPALTRGPLGLEFAALSSSADVLEHHTDERRHD